MPEGISDVVGKRRFPYSFNELARFGGGSYSAQRLFLSQLAHEDVVFWYEDFVIDTINLDFWTTGETGSGTPWAVPATPILGGAVVGVTGTSSGNCEALYGAPVWAGSNNAFFEARLKIDVITTLMAEVGLFDAATSYAIALVNDVDTPSVNAGVSDVAVLSIDTSQTLTTMAFVTDGSTSNYNTTATTLSPVFTPTAAVYHTYRVGTAGNQSYSAVVSGGVLVATTGTGATAQLGPAAAVLIRPWIAVRTRTTAAKTGTLDYVFLQQDRNVRVA